MPQKHCEMLTFITQTIQLCSRACLSETETDNINKPKPEDNRKLLLSVFDSLNNLHEKLSRLDYLLERKIIEQNIYRKYRGE